MKRQLLNNGFRSVRRAACALLLMLCVAPAHAILFHGGWDIAGKHKWLQDGYGTITDACITGNVEMDNYGRELLLDGATIDCGDENVVGLKWGGFDRYDQVSEVTWLQIHLRGRNVIRTKGTGIENNLNQQGNPIGLEIIGETPDAELIIEGGTGIDFGGSRYLIIRDCAVRVKGETYALVGDGMVELNLYDCTLTADGGTSAGITGVGSVDIRGCEVLNDGCYWGTTSSGMQVVYYNDEWEYETAYEGEVQIGQLYGSVLGRQLSSVSTPYGVETQLDGLTENGSVSYFPAQHRLSLSSASLNATDLGDALIWYGAARYADQGDKVVNRPDTLIIAVEGDCAIHAMGTAISALDHLRIQGLDADAYLLLEGATGISCDGADTLAFENIQVEIDATRDGLIDMRGTNMRPVTRLEVADDAYVRVRGAEHASVALFAAIDARCLTEGLTDRDADGFASYCSGGEFYRNWVELGTRPAQPVGLTLGDVAVTDQNAADIFGDGTAAYDAAKHILTLNGCTIDSEWGTTGIAVETARFEATDTLTIRLRGKNAIVMHDDFAAGLELGIPVLIASDKESAGSLSIDAPYMGIASSKAIILRDCSVSIGATSDGLFGGSHATLTIDHATLSVAACQNATCYAFGDIVLKNAEVKAPTTAVITEHDYFGDLVKSFYNNGERMKEALLIEPKADAVRSAQADATATNFFRLDGRRTNGVQRGITIVRRADGSSVKVVK